MMIPAEHFCLQIVTYLVYQINLQERLATYKIPNYAFFPKLTFMVKNIVYGLFGNIKRHSLFLILAHKIAILAGKLAVFRDNERDVLCHTRLPIFTLGSN